MLTLMVLVAVAFLIAGLIVDRLPGSVTEFKPENVVRAEHVAGVSKGRRGVNSSSVMKLLEERCRPGAEVGVVSCSFHPRAHWEPNGEWLSFLKALLEERGVKLRLVGGRPASDEVLRSLRELISLGAEVRLLDKPIKRRHVVYCTNEPLVWYEERHGDEVEARGVYLTLNATEEQLANAKAIFNDYWAKGRPL